MKHTIFFLLLFTSIDIHALNPFWVHTDKKLIQSITKLDKNNPREVEQYFMTQQIQICDTTKENLGFGWKIWSPGIGGGYISISAVFYYYQNILISYSLQPDIPDEKKLQKRYKKWYRNSFSYLDSTIQPWKYNENAILKPLLEYKGNLKSEYISEKIVEYMTPISGTMYGYAGSIDLLQNRKAFTSIQNNLTNDEVVLIMYSINPASRFTAIEYYLKNRKGFKNNKSIDDWVEKNFSEIPTVETLFGCSREIFDSRSLVNLFSRMVEK